MAGWQSFAVFCAGQHNSEHTGEMGRAVSTMEAAEKRSDNQFVYCWWTASDWWWWRGEFVLYVLFDNCS